MPPFSFPAFPTPTTTTTTILLHVVGTERWGYARRGDGDDLARQEVYSTSTAPRGA